MLHVYRKCFLNTLHDQTFPDNSSSGFIGCLPPTIFPWQHIRTKTRDRIQLREVRDMRHVTSE